MRESVTRLKTGHREPRRPLVIPARLDGVTQTGCTPRRCGLVMGESRPLVMLSRLMVGVASEYPNSSPVINFGSSSGNKRIAGATDNSGSSALLGGVSAHPGAGHLDESPCGFAGDPRFLRFRAQRISSANPHWATNLSGPALLLFGGLGVSGAALSLVRDAAAAFFSTGYLPGEARSQFVAQAHAVFLEIRGQVKGGGL